MALTISLDTGIGVSFNTAHAVIKEFVMNKIYDEEGNKSFVITYSGLIYVDVAINERNNIGNKNLKTFLPATIGIEVNKPSHAFLEKVKNAAIPVDIRNPKVIVFLNKFFLFSRNNAMQNGQTKLSQDAA